MLKNETFRDLLYGGLNDEWKSICQEWVDEAKLFYNVRTDQEVIAAFSDQEILPLIARAATTFKNKATIYSNFIGLPTPRFDMFVTQIEGQPTIVIHEGFLLLFRFLNEIHYTSSLQYYDWDFMSEEDRENLEAIQSSINQSIIRITLEFLEKPFRLPSFHKKLPVEMQGKLDDEFLSIFAFAMYHEIGHCELEHNCSSNKSGKPMSVLLSDHEKITADYQHLGRAYGVNSMNHYHPVIDNIDGSDPNLKIDESLNRFKKQEFEADEYAIRSAGGNTILFYAGICLFYNHLSFLERITPKGKTHPLALNRLSHLEKNCTDLFSTEMKMMISGLKNEIFNKIEDIQDNESDYFVQLELTRLAEVNDYVQYLTVWMDAYLESMYRTQKDVEPPGLTHWISGEKPLKRFIKNPLIVFIANIAIILWIIFLCIKLSN